MAQASIIMSSGEFEHRMIMEALSTYAVYVDIMLTRDVLTYRLTFVKIDDNSGVIRSGEFSEREPHSASH